MADGDAPGWARAARDGDRAAFSRLYHRYSRMVHGILLVHVPPSDAEDLVQDVFLSAFQHLDGLRDDEAFGAWLAGIARNKGRDHRKTARRRSAMDAVIAAFDGGLQWVGLGFGRPADVGRDAQDVLDAIRALPEAYQEPLVLRLVEGMGGPEIAEHTGLQPGSVRVNLHRGMQLLRERLADGGKHG